MKRIIGKIKIIEYGILLKEKSLLTDKEVAGFVEAFPERKKEIRYIDVIMNEGEGFLLSSDMTLVSVYDISPDSYRDLLEGNGYYLKNRNADTKPISPNY